jgi:DNA-binding NtrC family response regulator
MSEQKRVLVVDDQADICEVMRDILEMSGYLVDTAVTGRSALKLLADDRYEVAVVDALLPQGVSGLKLAEELAARGCRVIVMTGSLTMREALDAAPYPVLTKPFRMSELTTLIESVLEEP